VRERRGGRLGWRARQRRPPSAICYTLRENRQIRNVCTIRVDPRVNPMLLDVSEEVRLSIYLSIYISISSYLCIQPRMYRYTGCIHLYIFFTIARWVHLRAYYWTLYKRCIHSYVFVLYLLFIYTTTHI